MMVNNNLGKYFLRIGYLNGNNTDKYILIKKYLIMSYHHLWPIHFEKVRTHSNYCKMKILRIKLIVNLMYSFR